MIRILFICHGNICRSPMAEYIMKELVNKTDCSGLFQIDSAATSSEELGNDLYGPAKRILREKGIPFSRHFARRMTKSDYDRYDWLIGCDDRNVSNMIRICGGDPNGKIRMLLDRPVADPWYTGDFEAAYLDILEGCSALLKELLPSR